jgi:hypothetical protein
MNDYLDLYNMDQDGTDGTTTETSGGLGMSTSERASVPSYNSRKKKGARSTGKKPKGGTLAGGALMTPNHMNTEPKP